MLRLPPGLREFIELLNVKKFAYRYAGRDFRPTEVHGHVVKELIA